MDQNFKKLVYKESWEERIYKLYEVIMVDEEGEQIGERISGIKIFKEKTDGEVINMIDWDDLSDKHWIKQQHKKQSIKKNNL